MPSLNDMVGIVRQYNPRDSWHETILLKSLFVSINKSVPFTLKETLEQIELLNSQYGDFQVKVVPWR